MARFLPGQTGAGTAEKVAMPYLTTRVELTADGKPVWTGVESQIPPPINPQPFRLPAADTDLTAWLRERAWHRLPEAWGKLALPGTSEFGPDGPRPVMRKE